MTTRSDAISGTSLSHVRNSTTIITASTPRHKIHSELRGFNEEGNYWKTEHTVRQRRANLDESYVFWGHDLEKDARK